MSKPIVVVGSKKRPIVMEVIGEKGKKVGEYVINSDADTVIEETYVKVEEYQYS